MTSRYRKINVTPLFNEQIFYKVEIYKVESRSIWIIF